MVFIHVASRRVYVSSCTAKPTSAWVCQQTRQFLAYAKQRELPLATISRDNDFLYRWFDDVLAAEGVAARRTAIRAPNTNAFVERFIQSLQVECLDHFLVFGEKHLDYLVREYIEHYHTERPHQGLGNRRVEEPPPDVGKGEIVVRTRLGGLLKS